MVIIVWFYILGAFYDYMFEWSAPGQCEHLHNNRVSGAPLIDLSKALDCLHLKLLIAKFDTYGFDLTSMK